MGRLAEEIVRKPQLASKLDGEAVKRIIYDAGEVLEGETYFEVEGGRVLFVGDTHGDLYSTMAVARRFLREGYDLAVFLGDYVDRGAEQVGNMNFVLSLKTVYPDRVILLRGNHETPLANRYYGFMDAVSRRFSFSFYRVYASLFASLPYACLVNGSVLCLHGGIAKGLERLSQLREIPREVEVEDPIGFQVLWNDPHEGVRGFKPSPRGPGIYVFGEDVFTEFAEENGVEVMVRAHEVFPQGFKWYFRGRILSLFSAAQYTIPVNAKVGEMEGGDLRVVDVFS